MENRIVNPNGSDRRGYMYVGIFFFCLILLQCLFNATHPAIIITETVCALLVLMIAYISRPYVVMEQNGITVRFFCRRRFYAWNEVEQTGIRDTKAKRVSIEYRFPVVIILPSKSKWYNDIPLWRDMFRSVVVPNRPEIKSFVLTHYGPLDFNDIDKLNDWEKKYYHFD